MSATTVGIIGDVSGPLFGLMDSLGGDLSGSGQNIQFSRDDNYIGEFIGPAESVGGTTDLRTFASSSVLHDGAPQ